MTSGTTIFETVKAFETEAPSIRVNEAIVVVDRQEPRISSLDSKVDSIFLLKDFVQPQVQPRISFLERAQSTTIEQNAKQLFSIIDAKKTNLIVSIDETEPAKILQLTIAVSSYVCAIKYHSDIWDVHDSSQLMSFRKVLYEASKNSSFMIFEDRKFADIGAIVQKQFRRIQGNYFNKDTIELVTVLPSAGRGTIDAIKKESNKVGILLVSELSSVNNFIDEKFTKRSVELAYNNPQYITGFIVQKRAPYMTNDDYVYCTPGVREDKTTDTHDQQYRTIKDAIIFDRCDVIIVGRGITQNPNPGERAQFYAKKAYSCYQKGCTLIN